MNVKISKISSLTHYHFSVKEFAGTKTYFLRRFIIMRNAYIFSLFGSQSKYLAQFFNVLIRILSSLLQWKNSRRHFIYHSRVLKPDKLEGAFQMENLAIFFILLNEYRLNSRDIYKYRAFKENVRHKYLGTVLSKLKCQ